MYKEGAQVERPVCQNVRRPVCVYCAVRTEPLATAA
jgi:hypothetical protein